MIINRWKIALYLWCFLMITGILTYFYGRYIERVWVEYTTLTLESPEWTGHPIRLAVLADIHASPDDGAYLDRLVQHVVNEKPDAVLLLGDYINGHDLNESMPMNELEEHLIPLTRFPCYAITGNHDYYAGIHHVHQLFKRLGIRLVEGRRETLRTQGGQLSISGTRCLATFSRPSFIPEKIKGEALIWLSHTPLGVHYAPEGTLITLAGHTHGGQICFPGGKYILKPDSCPRPDCYRGLTQVKGKALYTSRGLGTSILPLRFFCRPELLILKIIPAREQFLEGK